MSLLPKPVDEGYVAAMSRVFVTCCLLAAPAFAQPVVFPSLTDAEKQKLERRGVVIHDLEPTGGRGVSAEAMALIDASTSEVWPLLRDCEHFSQFMPNTKASARKVENGESLCFDEIGLPFPLPNLWADTRSEVREEPTGHFVRSWSLVRGNYRRNRGAWKALPWGVEGKQSLVVYLIDSDPEMIIPDPLLRAAQTGSLPDVFKALRKRLATVRAAER